MSISDIAIRIARKIPKVYDAGYTEGVKKAESKPYLDTSGITDFYYFCTRDRFTFDELLCLDTSSGTDFSSMFNKCTSLTTIPELDTSNGTDFSNMFNSCTHLIAIPELDISKGAKFNSMFVSCTSLTTIPELDTSNGTGFSNMFSMCPNLKIISELNISNGTSFSNMFYDCSSLTDITFTGTIGQSLSFQYSPLSKDSIFRVINALSGTVSGKTLTLKKSAVEDAFGIDMADPDTYTEEFYSLQTLKPNWSVSLV